MKVGSISTPHFIKKIVVATPLLLSPITGGGIANYHAADIFEKTTPQEKIIMVHDENVLSPKIKVGKEYIRPTVIVDKSENELYLYDSKGYLKSSFSVGLGKKTTPTKIGLRKVVGIESYPYKNAPKQTKRHQFPNDYGPKVIVLGIVDPKTGEVTGFNGEFIHGTNKPESIGKNESKGCVRMNNEEVKQLATELEIGQYVLIRE